MGTNAHDKPFSSKQLAAIEKLAEGVLTHDEIAEAIDVAPSTLTRWKGVQAFDVAVKDAKAAYRAALRAEGVAHKQNLIDNINDRLARLYQVLDERAADPEMQDVPGGKTGLIVKTYKAVGVGPDMKLMPEYAVDVPTLRAMLDHEKQGAQLVGFWEDKLNVNGSLKREYVIVTETEDGDA